MDAIGSTRIGQSIYNRRIGIKQSAVFIMFALMYLIETGAHFIGAIIDGPKFGIVRLAQVGTKR